MEGLANYGSDDDYEDSPQRSHVSNQNMPHTNTSEKSP